jgi:predicted lipoprotein with Yx(FWY)xxD motif
MTRGTLLTFGAIAVLAAGCGSDDEPNGDAGSKPAATSKPAKAKAKKPAPEGRTVKAVKSQFGQILGDRRGVAFYLFDKEKTKKPGCYGACAKAWPPVLTKGKPQAGKGVRGSLLGTTKRRDGKLQVTYAGKPMYYYEHDGPGRVLCHNVEEFGGLWLVLRGSGKTVG